MVNAVRTDRLRTNSALDLNRVKDELPLLAMIVEQASGIEWNSTKILAVSRFTFFLPTFGQSSARNHFI